MSVAYLSGSVKTLFNETTTNYSNPYPYDSGTTGADRLLVVTTMHENGASGPTGVTYGGVSLTQSAIVEVAPTDYFSETGYIWTLVNPATGTNDIVITGSGGGVDGGATAAVYTGVNPATPIGNIATATAIVEPDATTVSITKQDEKNLIVWTYVSDRADRKMVAIEDNVGLVLTETDVGNDSSASSFGTGYREIGSGLVLVGANRTAGVFEDNGIAAIELMASQVGPVTPINLSTTNLLATSVRLTWEQG